MGALGGGRTGIKARGKQQPRLGQQVSGFEGAQGSGIEKLLRGVRTKGRSLGLQGEEMHRSCREEAESRRGHGHCEDCRGLDTAPVCRQNRLRGRRDCTM